MQSLTISADIATCEGVIVVEWEGVKVPSYLRQQGADLSEALYMLLPNETAMELVYKLADKLNIEIPEEA